MVVFCATFGIIVIREACVKEKVYGQRRAPGLNLLSVFLRGDPHDFFESTEKVGIVAESAEERYITEGNRFEQLLLGQHDTPVKDVVVNAVVRIAHEFMGEGSDFPRGTSAVH